MADVLQSHVSGVDAIRPSAMEPRDLLTEAFPRRGRQIDDLLNLLGGPFDPLPPLLVYGGTGVGKSRVVRAVLEALERPYAIASWRCHVTLREGMEAIVNQLVGHVRSSSNKYGSYRQIKKSSDFTTIIPEAVAKAVDRNNVRKKGKADPERDKKKENIKTDKISEDQSEIATCQPTVYIVWDNIEILKDWEGGIRMLTSFLRLPEISGQKNLSIIMISSLGWDCFRCDTGSREPIPLNFSDYTDEDLIEILGRKHSNSSPYISFLRTVVPAVARATLVLGEVERVVEGLYRWREREGKKGDLPSSTASTPGSHEGSIGGTFLVDGEQSEPILYSQVFRTLPLSLSPLHLHLPPPCLLHCF